MEETGVPEKKKTTKKHRPWMDDHYPVTCQCPESNTDRSDDKARDIPLRYPCPPYTSCSLPPSEKRHRPWMDEHYPVKCQSLESNTGRSGDKARDNLLRYPSMPPYASFVHFPRLKRGPYLSPHIPKKKTSFFIQKRFHKLIYSINTIIKCGI